VSEKFRWWLWALACRLPRVCPANAHTSLILSYPGRRRSPLVDDVCRSDCAANGECWCRKLRRGGTA
jgi:hypothetical protein